MTKIDIVSGFLGAGKTTLIKKLLSEAYVGEDVVLIENEFGEIGVDGGFLAEAGIEIKEMNSGCICCSLVGDFGASLHEVIDKYSPKRIIIEPSGVGKLSDVIKAVEDAHLGEDVVLSSAVAVVDASKAKIYIKNFGEFFNNQIENAQTIILSRTGIIDQQKLDKAVELIREHNDKATIITTPWEELDAKTIIDTFENAHSFEEELMEQVKHEHHHHHDGDCDCGCHEHEHHHHHDDDCDCGCHEHEHHHHHDDDCDCGCHEHEHHHHHDDDCDCGCHEHEHHHHADDIFSSWGIETSKKFTKEEIEKALDVLESDSSYGMILRAKGIVPASDGTWIYFDYVPGEKDIRIGKADVTGKLCVIGSNISKDSLDKLFI